MSICASGVALGGRKAEMGVNFGIFASRDGPVQ